MFVRKVGARLNPGSLKKFAHLMEFEILPWLREQEGFLDLITLAEPDGCQVATLTFWHHESNAQSCDGCGSNALRILGQLLDGVPYVKTFEVLGSTLHRLSPERRSCETGELLQRNHPESSGLELF